VSAVPDVPVSPLVVAGDNARARKRSRGPRGLAVAGSNGRAHVGSRVLAVEGDDARERKGSRGLAVEGDGARESAVQARKRPHGLAGGAGKAAASAAKALPGISKFGRQRQTVNKFY
jgi:hypothetical protein